MKPAPFEYFAPRALDEALDRLARYGAEAKVLAGGQSLVPLMNMRLARPAVVVDINRLPGLGEVREADGGLTLGALTRQRTLERASLVQARAPLLGEAALRIGHLQTRARGTVGGSLVHADPAAELPACAVLLDAGFTLASARRRRTVRAAEFYVGLMTTTLAPDELLVEVRVPAAPLSRTGTAIVEVARRHGDFALVGAVALVGLDGGGTCRDARLVFLGVGDVPRPAAAVSGLVGAGPDAGRLHEVGRAAAGELDPPSDLHASSAYRRQVAAVVATQALADAWRRAAAVPA